MTDENEQDVYLVWSNEHRMWWGPAMRGYRQSLAAAGRYNREDALAICQAVMPGTAKRLGMLPALPVRLADVRAFTEAFLAKYPHRQGDWQ